MLCFAQYDDANRYKREYTHEDHPGNLCLTHRARDWQTFTDDIELGPDTRKQVGGLTFQFANRSGKAHNLSEVIPH